MVQVLDSGTREFRPPDPDGFREWVRENKSRELKNKVISEREAVERYVADGDYLCIECCYTNRGPNSLLREIVRQRKKDLWLAGRFMYFDATILIGAGCVSKLDVGYFGLGRSLHKAIETGKVKTVEWSNGAMTMRLLAGAMGAPFAPVRFLGGTDAFRNSGAKLIEDPFTGKPVVLLPALNPDVAIIHAHQCDVYGNARVFGTSVSPKDVAMASRKVIVSAEEIIDAEETRRNPGLTTIPYYFVDAVVDAPFGSHPGTMPGLYGSDTEHIIELMMLANADKIETYLDKYIYSVETQQQYLEQRVGLAKLLQFKRNEVIKEGYR